MNLYTVLQNGFPADRKSCAIETSDGREYSWHDIETNVNRIANLLNSLHLPAGSRVAAQIEKSPEALFLYLACLKSAYVFLPLNTAYQQSELEYFINDAKPALVICSPAAENLIFTIAKSADIQHVLTLGPNRDGSLFNALAGCSDHCETLSCEDNDLAALVYTSGTTGRSKGAMLTHGNLISNALVLHKAWHWQKDDVLLHALPIFHVHGLFVACHGALLNGSKMIWLPKFDLNLLLQNLPRTTVLMGIPTFYVRLLADERFNRQKAANIRLFVSGSAPLLADTFHAFEHRTGKAILERYGMSETLMLVSNPYDGPRIAGSVGVPLPSTEVRVVSDDGRQCSPNEVGNIEVRGPNVFRGYWNMPEKTKEEFTPDGWFKTGDMGHWGGQTSAGPIPKNYLCIVGRIRDMIISGGFNVYPKEIETYLDDLPEIDESAVIGIPHPDLGESVMAVIVPKAGFKPDQQMIMHLLREKIAHFKVPKQIVIVNELPRNAIGKVQKNLLRIQFGQKQNH